MILSVMIWLFIDLFIMIIMLIILSDIIRLFIVINWK